jgi:transcriptional repressor NrdR
MQCPYCQYTNSRVLESRSAENGQSIRRRRECLQCKHRFTTYERIEFVPITVLKYDGTKESFDRSKLLRGMVRACEKTGIAYDRLETIVDEIESQLQQCPERAISSYEIGQLVLEHLRRENEVAYVRFASVYGRFQGIKEFVETLNQLQKKKSTAKTPEEFSTPVFPESLELADASEIPVPRTALTSS